jgi:RNase H-fold protein (predicted Holliday junction resolvase)
VKKKQVKKRIKVDEVYIDEKEDVSLALRKLYALLSQINKKKERVVLVFMDELKYPEEEGVM